MMINRLKKTSRISSLCEGSSLTIVIYLIQISETAIIGFLVLWVRHVGNEGIESALIFINLVFLFNIKFAVWMLVSEFSIVLKDAHSVSFS